MTINDSEADGIVHEIYEVYHDLLTMAMSLDTGSYLETKFSKKLIDQRE
jgi:hypothetical protein